MSHHLDNNKCVTPKPQHPCGSVSFNHETGEMSKTKCGCNAGEVKPSKLDLLIEQYNALMAEAQEAKNKFLLEALAFDIQEASKKSVEQMFDGEMISEEEMWLPSMDVDDNGDVKLNIVVDEDGNAFFVDD